MLGRLSDQKTLNKFRQWMNENALNPDGVKNVDVIAEFGKDLTFHEAVMLATQKFPTLWKPTDGQGKEVKPKQIIFVKDLIGKIEEGKVHVTYRKTPKIGTFYIIDNRFRQNVSSRLLIEFYRTDKVNAYDLTDEEAQLAGVETADKIRTLFERWYGNPIPTLYRNWFKLCNS